MHIDLENIAQFVEAVSDELEADVFLLNAPIDRNLAYQLMFEIRNIPDHRKNVALILTTLGGDPDAAYMMTRFIQQKYDLFTLFINGLCKSAGTLVAVGADEIIMSDFAELGPLDIQYNREDEVYTYSSGLDISNAILTLSEKAFDSFEKHFRNTKERISSAITTKTASDIAAQLANGIIGPISSQIDPLKLGESERALRIAENYGKRLNPSMRANLSKLIMDYPSHSFIIDRYEAVDIFKNVRFPNDAQTNLLDALLEHSLLPSSTAESKLLQHLNPIPHDIESENFTSLKHESSEIPDQQISVGEESVPDDSGYAIENGKTTRRPKKPPRRKRTPNTPGSRK